MSKEIEKAERDLNSINEQREAQVPAKAIE
jgi:hypothetical protein